MADDIPPTQPPLDDGEIVTVDIEDEVQRSYLDYAMSVIVGRALPDVRDGLKPVHRRILWGMDGLGARPGVQHMKCARVTGEVMGKYHPHGNQAIYDALARMAQDFAMRHPLVDGKGNFGSVDGDPPAAERYCVTGDTLVRTVDGTVPIRALAVAEPNSDVDIAIKVLDHHGNPVLATKFFHSGDHPTLRLQTAEGYEITGTGNHPLLCLESIAGVPLLQWRTLDEIGPGAWVVVVREDGAGGPSPGESDRASGLVAAGEAGDACGGIPSFIWVGSGERKRAFLQGVFEWGGSVSAGRRNSRTIRLSSQNGELVKGVQRLLLEFGVISWREPDGLRIAGRHNVQLFERRVGFPGVGFAGVGFRGTEAVAPGHRALPRERVPFVAEYIRSEGDRRRAEVAATIEPLVSGRYYFAKVTAVTDAAVQPVYSIRVDSDAHAFVANGFVNHNTECRLAPLAMELLRDIDEDTVDMIANYDGREEEPVILPARFPNLLVNGSTGIAVGMATNIPPHNLGEVIDATVALIDNPELVGEDLMKIVKGPDFPGGGSILGITGIKDAFETGRGSVRVRGKAEVEETKRGQRIVITELPYMVSGDRLLEKIHELLEAKRITGITNGRNESNRKGIRIVLELKRDAIPQVVLNNLYKFTQLQDSFGINMLALVEGVPRTLPLVEILRAYINHQVAVITRRTRFRLRKAEDRMHTLMGLLVALDQLDAIIMLIREAESAEAARTQLMARAWEVSAETTALLERAGASAAAAAEAVAGSGGGTGGSADGEEPPVLGLDAEGRFHLSERQATAILDMALRRLAGLERQNLREEATGLAGTIAELRAILDSPARLRRIIREELIAIRDKFANARRTQIIADEGEIDIEDLIPDDDVVVTITRSGYVKRTKSANYKIQGRGGKGVIGAKPKEGDIVAQVLTTTNHAFVLVFSTRGKVYRIKAHEIPEKERTARGTSIRNILPFTPEEAVAAVIDTRDFEAHKYLVSATKKGIIKKTEFNAYNTSRKDGIIALTLREDDEVVMVKATSGEDEVIMVSRKGMAIRFPETDVRPMGRTAGGVIAMSLSPEDVVVDFDVVDPNAELLIVTDGGYGKRTLLTHYPTQHRGGKGVITAKLPGKRGVIAGAWVVRPGNEVFLIASDGQVIRMEARSIARQGRDTTGVRVMRLDSGVTLVGLAPVTDEE